MFAISRVVVQRRGSATSLEGDDVSEAPGEVLQIDVSTGGDGSVVLTLSGEFDLVSVGAFDDALADVQSRRPKRTVMDVSGLAFLDSSGINALLRATKALQAEGGTVVLRSPSLATRRILEIAHVTELVAIVEDANPPGATPETSTAEAR
jgi:stage II sporulation protein AA (anti-sigma F factor antagonist)